MASSDQWYYLRKRERFGPVKESELCALISDGTLTRKSYIWCKGFVDWRRIESVDELDSLASPPLPEIPDIPSYDMTVEKKLQQELPSITRPVNWKEMQEAEKIFAIRTGYDRNDKNGTEYGPFSLRDLRIAYDENRINEKSLVFTRGMENWEELRHYSYL